MRSRFERRRHLVFALLASGLAVWVINSGPAPARFLLDTTTWTPEAALANVAVLLLAVEESRLDDGRVCRC